MGSRLRDNVKQFFECFCEVAQQNGEKQPWILQKYPESYNDPEVLKSVPKFAYPCEIQNVTIQHFSFVLTSLDSKWTFGFCRHDPKTETALVILSSLPWHEAFYKLLNHIATLISSSNAGNLWKFLGDVYEATLPVPGASVSIPLPGFKTTFVFQRPNQFQLPSIPENRNLTEYFSAVDSHNMMMVFASMLYERRIIFTSKKLSRLSACVQACNALIYPMIWQHIYIPVLPHSLTDYLLAPMPFLIGVLFPILEQVRQSDLGEVVILNADTNTIESPFQDLESLPQDVVTNLRRALRNGPALLGDGVSRAFLRALVQLTAGYREALTLQQGQHDDHVRITFDQEAFVESRPLPMQPFLRKMLELQIFQQFIEERLHMLNSGLGFSDEFEIEACNYSDKSGSKFMQQYREWTYAMRKEGSAFIRSVKDKANPAVKYAVKSVKDKGKDVKTACKGLKWKGRAIRGDNAMRFHQPRSAPNSPISERRGISFASPSKSPSGLTPTTSYRKELRLPNSNVETSRKQYSPLNPTSPDDQDQPPEHLHIDLLNELRDVIFPNTPAVDRSLKPVRSLDSLRSGRMVGRSRHLTPRAGNSLAATTTKSSPYEHYQVPCNATLKNSRPVTHPIIDKIRSDSSIVDNNNSNNCTTMRPKTTTAKRKLARRRVPLRAQHRPNQISVNDDVDADDDDDDDDEDDDDDDQQRSRHEFVNPIVKPTAELCNRLRTEDPFELYGSPSSSSSHFSPSDPFDTSQVLNPFGLPNPLFRATTTRAEHVPKKQSQHQQQQQQQQQQQPSGKTTTTTVTTSSSSSSYSSARSSLSPRSSPQPPQPPLLPPKASSLANRAVKQVKATEVQDLIRLDSTNSDDDFDPLLCRSSAEATVGNNSATAVNLTNVHKQMSQSMIVPGSAELMGEGLSNPLYPYFTPKHQQNCDNNTPNKSKIGDHDLLQEYGLDFAKFNLSNGNAAVAAAATASSRFISQTKLQTESNYNNVVSNSVNAPPTNNVKPFGTAFGSQQTVKSPSNWTKFE